MAIYQLTASGHILRTSDGAMIPADLGNLDYVAYLAWVAAGNTADPVPAPPLSVQVLAYENAIQAALDSYAQSWGYTDLVTAASYAASTNPQYAAEAKALIAWRDEVWVWAEAYEAQVVAGTVTIPTSPAGLMAAMPPAPTRPTA
jgi:hypothetical protein